MKQAARVAALLLLAEPCAPWSRGLHGLRHQSSRASVPVRAQESSIAVSEGGATASRHLGGRSAGVKRVRQHVNPLRSSHQQPLQLPDRWPETFFKDPSLPFHLDIGCARGLFCLDYAAEHPQVNILGLEIRRPLVELANADVERLRRGNVAFLTGNANSHLETICSGCGAGAGAPLRSVSIQFPDPHFKKKHHKRRVMQPDLARSLAANIAPGGWLFVRHPCRKTEPDAAGQRWDYGLIRVGVRVGIGDLTLRASRSRSLGLSLGLSLGPKPKPQP